MKLALKIVGILIAIWVTVAFIFPNYIAAPLAAWNSSEAWKEHIRDAKDLNVADFKFIYTDHYGSEGYVLKYHVDQDSLKIHYNCDFTDCKDSIIYSAKLKKSQVYEFYKKLKSINTDTLKSFYQGEGVGHDLVKVKIKGYYLDYKEIILIDYQHSEIEKISFEIDQLLPSEKYRIHKN